MSTTHPLTIYLPDQRDVTISRYGRGNAKIGPSVYTYSRLAGRTETCPGATHECEAVCYAKRIEGIVYGTYARNSLETETVPPIPSGARLLRIHVSGDFDSVAFIDAWIARLTERPDVTAWAYTRSWRIPDLLPALERLRALPNMQLFASMDPSTREYPPAGWRRAWIWREWKANAPWPMEDRIGWPERIDITTHHGPTITIPAISGPFSPRQGRRNGTVRVDDTPAYVCPEETGHKANCETCRYCFDGQRGDVIFLEH